MTHPSAESHLEPGTTQSSHGLSQAQVLQLLSHAAPRLWAKACSQKSLRREQRKRFVELLDWLLSRNGFTVLTGTRQNYFDKGRQIEGVLDLKASSNAVTLAIEISMSPSLPSAYKLLAAKKEGATPVLLAGFAANPQLIHEQLTRIAERPTVYWFKAYSLQSHATATAVKPQACCAVEPHTAED